MSVNRLGCNELCEGDTTTSSEFVIFTVEMKGMELFGCASIIVMLVWTVFVAGEN